jgi:hypothetical protein
MALLPYSVRQVTQRKGSRRDRDREPREETRAPVPDDADAEAFAVEEADPATAELLEDSANGASAAVVDDGQAPEDAE